jgi:HK97 family phage major capsid protein
MPKRLQELANSLSAKTAKLDKIFAKYTDATGAVNTKAITAQDSQLIDQLDDEIQDLKFQITAARNQEFRADMLKPVNAIPFSGKAWQPPSWQGGDDDAAMKAYTPASYSSVGGLKSFTLGSRQENEQSAYKFFQWFAATCLRPGSPLQMKAFEFCAEHGIPIKALNESNNEQGGALVPPQFDSELIRLVEKFGIFRSNTRVKPMSSDTLMVPRRTGGVTANWIGEGKPITQSQPSYDNIQLVCKKLATLVVMSSEVNEDSAISFADELAFEIAQAFALAEDQAGFLGDGTSPFGGIQGVIPKLRGLDATIANIAGLVVAAGDLWSEFTLLNFNAVVALLPQYADTQSAGWYCHRSFYFGVMQRLELAQGGVTMSETAQGDRRPRPLFLGYPVNFTQVFPRTDAVSQIACLLGDLGLASKFGDRRTRTLFTDPYSLAANDQIQVRGTERIDLVVHDVGNASATPAQRVPGPIVGLISAAS